MPDHPKLIHHKMGGLHSFCSYLLRNYFCYQQNFYSNCVDLDPAPTTAAFVFHVVSYSVESHVLILSSGEWRMHPEQNFLVNLASIIC